MTDERKPSIVRDPSTDRIVKIDPVTGTMLPAEQPAHDEHGSTSNARLCNKAMDIARGLMADVVRHERAKDGANVSRPHWLAVVAVGLAFLALLAAVFAVGVVVYSH